MTALDVAAALDADLTLSDTLARLGLTHRPSERGHGRRDVMRDDEVLTSGTAAETWAWLREWAGRHG